MANITEDMAARGTEVPTGNGLGVIFSASRDTYITLDADGEETVKSCHCCNSPPHQHAHQVDHSGAD